MALNKLPFENSLPPSRKHLFHPPFQRQRKRKISHLTPEITILERGLEKIVLERGSSFGREETKCLIFLLPLLKFSLITLSHPTSPDPIQL